MTDFLQKVISNRISRTFLTKYSPRLYTNFQSYLIQAREPEIGLLSLLCDRTKLSVDVGVLYGAYSWHLLKYSKRVIAFEPNPRQFTLLERVFKKELNNSLYQIENLALSNTKGSFSLRIPKGIPGNATIEDLNTLSGRDQIEETRIETITMDSLKLADVGFIKIDVEGHEVSVIEGMLECIEHNRPTLIIEIEERHNKASFGLIEGLMKKFDYKIYYLSGSGIKEVEGANIGMLNQQKINNFIFVNSSNTDLIRKLHNYS